MKIKKILTALIAGALAASAMVVGTAAKDVDAGILQFNDREFTVKGMDRTILGEDPDKYPGWDAIYILGRGSADTEKLISQNYNVWKNVQKVTASFYLEDVDGTAFAEDMGYIQICGVMGEGANWQWFDNSANLLEQNESFAFGPDCVMTATWNIADFIAQYGKDVENGGVLKLSLMVGSNGIDDYNLRIVWTDVTVEGDEAAMAEAVATVTNLGAGASAVEETAETANAPAAGNTSEAPAATKGSADTGIEGVAVVTALAFAGVGSVIILRRKSK